MKRSGPARRLYRILVLTRLVKRRRALRERNLPRNSRPETHRDDGPGSGRQPVPKSNPQGHAIGSKDLRMPEKTHGRSLRRCRGACGLLELLRWPVAQRRMQPETIVVLLDERLDVGAQVIEIAILVGVDFFSLERFHEALTTGIVVRVRWPAHARNHLVLPQNRHVIPRRILHAAVRVMHQTRRRLPFRDGALYPGLPERVMI